jgi:hypothetical protein
MAFNKLYYDVWIQGSALEGIGTKRQLLKCIPVLLLNAMTPIAALRALCQEIFTRFNGRKQHIPVEGSGGVWLRR